VDRAGEGRRRSGAHIYEVSRPRPTNPTPPAILLGGDFTALAAARSLDDAGVEVHALGSRLDPVRNSRACARFVDGGDDLQRGWLEYLESAAPGAVVLPCSDDGLELVARNHSALLNAGLVQIDASPDVLLALLDKEQAYLLAAKAGIPVPATVAVADQAELASAAERIGFPCALKPAHSHLFTRHFPVKAFVAADRDELEGAFRRTRSLGLKMLITELIPGLDDAYPSCFSFLDEQGEPIFTITKSKLRQYPIGYGSACYHVTDWDPEAAELGVRFLQSVGMRGHAHVEFKRDARDGELKLIECNPRFTGTTGLLRVAGADLTLFTYNRLVGRQPPAIGEYRKGIALWWPLNDFRAFVAYRRREELSFARWAKTLARPLRLPLASWRDPKPTIVALGRKLGRAWRRLGRRS
jgi:D-aspartate ligase